MDEDQSKDMDHAIEINDLRPKSQRIRGNLHFEESQDFLSYEFSELNLPIRTIRPFWHLEDDLEDT